MSDATEPDPVDEPRPRGTAAASYLYCLVRTDRSPDARDLPAGLPDAGVPRLLQLEPSLWLVVGDVDPGRYSEERLAERLDDLEWVSEHAIAHERVVSHFVGDATIVPMKLFTIFSSDDRAVEHIRGQRQRIEAILDRVEGRVEIGVRVSLDREGARARAEESAAGSDAEAGRPGTAFLLGRKRQRDAARDAVAAARDAARECLQALQGIADESVRPGTSPPGATLLAEGSFLVRRERVGDFEEVADGWARRLSGLDCEVVLTGPWPPYGFAEPRP